MSILTSGSPDGKELTITVKGRFDFSAHQDFRNAYESAPHPMNAYIVDLRDATYLDSSALGMLLLLFIGIRLILLLLFLLLVLLAFGLLLRVLLFLFWLRLWLLWMLLLLLWLRFLLRLIGWFFLEFLLRLGRLFLFLRFLILVLMRVSRCA